MPYASAESPFLKNIKGKPLDQRLKILEKRLQRDSIQSYGPETDLIAALYLSESKNSKNSINYLISLTESSNNILFKESISKTLLTHLDFQNILTNRAHLYKYSVKSDVNAKLIDFFNDLNFDVLHLPQYISKEIDDFLMSAEVSNNKNYVNLFRISITLGNIEALRRLLTYKKSYQIDNKFICLGYIITEDDQKARDCLNQIDDILWSKIAEVYLKIHTNNGEDLSSVYANIRSNLNIADLLEHLHMILVIDGLLGHHLTDKEIDSILGTFKDQSNHVRSVITLFHINNLVNKGLKLNKIHTKQVKLLIDKHCGDGLLCRAINKDPSSINAINGLSSRSLIKASLIKKN
jgi:hypothetical protein